MTSLDPPDLTVEWERIYLLAVFAEQDRRGQPPQHEQPQRLGELKKAVDSLRQRKIWKLPTRVYGLSSIDKDILACAAAPEAEPRVGWIFRDLQPGVASPFPSPALMRELLAYDGVKAAEFQTRLAANAPLLENGLVNCNLADSYQPVRPTRRWLSQFLGWAPTSSEVPGAVRIKPRATLSDLVMPAYCHRRIQQLLLWCTRRKEVEELGVFPRGGPVALLAGPSGTGKTLAAEAIAAELGKPLYRVDLGLLVSKYIGETEKNLNLLFDGAADVDGVLLFDEADSLFGKRGEVKEARDRYANMEVSHLLARIERHVGMCLLTSNMRHHIDTAFTRRFHLVIDFPRPGVKQREELWERFLPQSARANEVKPAELAKQLELTGAQIEGAVQHAAFVAAADSASINYPAIANGVWNELTKQNGEVLRSSLGFLSDHLQGVGQ